MRAEHVLSSAARQAAITFKLMDGHDPNAGMVCQHLLAPAEQSPRRPEAAAEKHMAQLQYNMWAANAKFAVLSIITEVSTRVIQRATLSFLATTLRHGVNRGGAQLGGDHLKYTPELDGVRGWACGSVLILHCLTGISHPQDGSWMYDLREGTFELFLGGVDLFFVLSGFLIGGLLLDSKDKPHFFKSFWVRRIARIFPVAYLLLATYLVARFLTDHFQITRFDSWLLAENPAPIWTYVTFTQNVPMAMAGYGGAGPLWMRPTWSLAIEEQFYLLFPFAVYFLRRKWIIALVIGGIIAGPVIREVIGRVYGDWAAYLLSPPRIDVLLYGVAVALIVRSKRALSIATRYRLLLDAAALLILYSIVVHQAFPWWPGPQGNSYPLKQSLKAFMWAIMILRIFTYERSFFNRVWRNLVLTKIGLISYGVYMYNEVVNGLVHGLLFNQEPAIDNPEQLLVGFGAVAITLGLAAVSYTYLERPIRRYGAAVGQQRARGQTQKLSVSA